VWYAKAMSRHLPGLFALLTFLALFVGCSAAVSVPVVDSVNFPATATKDGTGNFAMTGTVAAHVSGGSISKLLVHVPPQNGVAFTDSPIDVSGHASPYTILLAIPGNVPVGTYTYQVTASDTAGTQSAPYNGSVVLQ
jgi:hypothetical protein